MKRPSRLPYLVCAFACLLPDSTAQAADEGRRTEALVLPHPEHVLFDQVEEGVLLAAGPTYKASVDAGGLTFVPFHGSEAPRNEPVGLELTSVEVGGEAIDVGGAASPRRVEEWIHLERGAVTEHFRCVPEGVELLIDVRVPSSARGPMEVRYRRVGNQEVVAGPGGGLTFRGEVGDVTLGAAFVVEPDGRRVPITVQAEPDGLRFVVPPEVVARSGGRLRIDPLIATGTITLNTFRADRSMDTAADESIGLYVAVERAFSATDRDVLVFRVGNFDVTGTLVSSIDISPADWTEPSIAARPSLDDFLVAATVGSGSARRIHARWGDGGGASVGQPFEVYSAVYPMHSPDICTETTGNFLLRRWCVLGVMDQLTTSWALARVVSGLGAGAAPTNLIETVQLGGNARAAIAETTGDGVFTPTRFRIAYTADGGVLDDLRVRVVDRDLGMVSDFPVISGLDVRGLDIGSAAGPSAASPLGTFPVVYDSGFSTLREVYLVLCDDAGPRGPRSALDDLMDAGRGATRSAPSVAGSGARWTIAFEERPDPALPSTILAVSGTEVAGRFGLTERRLLLSDVQRPSTRPTSVSRFEGGRRVGGGSTVLTAFVASNHTGGALHDSPPEDAAGSQFCEAAPNSTGNTGWLRALGGTSVANAKALLLEGAAASQFSLLFVAASTDFVPGIGGSAGNLCLGPDRFGRYNQQVRVTGPGGGATFVVNPDRIPQPTGTVAAVVGEDWYFQAWFRDAVGGVATSNLSNAIHMTFTP